MLTWYSNHVNFDIVNIMVYIQTKNGPLAVRQPGRALLPATALA
jgi:hypothetical protein